jgi:hypothetical protein
MYSIFHPFSADAISAVPLSVGTAQAYLGTWLCGGGISSSHFKKNTSKACHASAPLRWSQAVLAAFWCRSAGRGHALVRQGVSVYSAAIAEACNV